ncbi:MAG: ABC1 kinase family protein [Nannocystales bacterium]
MTDERKIPRGRLSRVAKLARAGATSGLAMLRSKSATGAADKVAGMLGEMRGVATKVGQMASYVDGLIPPEHAEAFERSMSKLRAGAPRSSASDIRRTLTEDLGAPPEDLFSSWEDVPIASASIGQVHRATLLDGRAVAVKVQHPGIAEAMEADMRNASLMDFGSRAFGFGKFEVGRLVDEAKARFREELDYGLERARYERFATLHASDPKVVIPEVISERCSSRVLTTAFVEGIDFDRACEASESDRRAWAQTQWRFVYGSIMLGGIFNADPHPGNYRFLPDGAVGFLDFGCVQEINNYNRRRIVAGHVSLAEGSFDGFEVAMAEMLAAQDGTHRREMASYMRHAVSPLLESPFRITREFAGEVVRRFRSMAKSMISLSGSDYAAMPEGILFLNRLQFGFYSVLARLDVQADYAAVERSFLDEAQDAVRDLPDSKARRG